MKEIEKSERLKSRSCWFQAGARQLHLGVEEHFRAATKTHPAFAVVDIDAVFDALRRVGARCMWDEPLGNIRRFYANDPWGNRLEFTGPTSSMRWLSSAVCVQLQPVPLSNGVSALFY